MTLADRVAELVSHVADGWENQLERGLRAEGWVRDWLLWRSPGLVSAHSNLGGGYGVLQRWDKVTEEYVSKPSPDAYLMHPTGAGQWIDVKLKQQMTFRIMRGGFECGCPKYLYDRYSKIDASLARVSLIYVVIDSSPPSQDRAAYDRCTSPPYEIPAVYPTGVYIARLRDVVSGARPTANVDNEECIYVRMCEPDGSLAPGVTKIATWETFVDDIHALGMLDGWDI